METLGEFLAHAIALEEESGHRFDALADSLEVHHNCEVTELFRKMAHFSRLHLREVRRRAQGVDVPALKPWEFRWPDPEAPETVATEDTHYRLSAPEALTLALDSERRGEAFYRWVAQTSGNETVRTLATDFADEEAEHVALLEHTQARYQRPPAVFGDDLEPPQAVD
ncbi:ferritin-like domain-containing protein [Pararhodospirillum photometricum]|uniref:Rubrerythrin n=1 Tax=Pararhodospirillum photometricum DSM 122 TaxID=1150469 RepID=H6SMP6_PARPM|nr:ferritin family protein [Pararhodospirillum photometricum]CCG09181.1 Rubrerythrin [Pararhodospirillum photometricum DSM 122]